MSNIKVDLSTPIFDGAEVKFRSPADCSQVTGLVVCYNGESQEFIFADSHGNNVGDIDHLFTEDVVVKVILDVTKGMAFVQNADTNAYLERRFQELGGGAVPYGKELPYSWKDLSGKCKNGDFSGIIIGDYKTITLTNGEEVVCEVAGIDTYYNRSGYEPCSQHHIDFISRDCLGSWRLNYNDAYPNPDGSAATPTNNGTSKAPNPYTASKLFNSLNDQETGIFTKLPKELQKVIIGKYVRAEARYSGSATQMIRNSGTTWCTLGQLWLPTEVEIWGRNTCSEDGANGANSGCNIQYPIFKDGLKHILKGSGNGGTIDNWWTSSAAYGDCISFCCVGLDGRADYSSAVWEQGVPLCFRVAYTEEGQ